MHMSRTINRFCTCFETESSTHKQSDLFMSLSANKTKGAHVHTHTQRSVVSARRFLCSACVATKKSFFLLLLSLAYFLLCLPAAFYFACPPPPSQPYCKQDHYPVPYPFISTEAVFFCAFPLLGHYFIGWLGRPHHHLGVCAASQQEEDGWLADRGSKKEIRTSEAVKMVRRSRL